MNQSQISILSISQSEISVCLVVPPKLQPLQPGAVAGQGVCHNIDIVDDICHNIDIVDIDIR